MLFSLLLTCCPCSFIALLWLADDNLSEDDMNECVPEDGLDGEGQGEPQSEGMKKKKKKGKDITAR